MSVNLALHVRVGALLVALLPLAGGIAPGVAQKKSSVRKQPVYYKVNAGQKMHVRLNEGIGSEKARVGDTFTTTLVDPIYSSRGVLLAPQGSIITGRVTNVQRAQKGGKPATMDVQFFSLKLPNGIQKQINGSLTDLSASSAQSDNEGTATAKTTKNRNVKFIGGGAGGGAVIGAIAGGGSGAAIGAGVGAVTGLVTSRLKKGHEVKVEPGTEFGVILNLSISLPKYGAM